MDIGQFQIGLPNAMDISTGSSDLLATPGVENFGNVIAEQIDELVEEKKSPLVIALENALMSEDIADKDKAILQKFVDFLQMQELRALNDKVPFKKCSCDKEELIEKIKEAILSGDITPEQAVKLMFMLTFLGILGQDDIEELMAHIKSSEESEEVSVDTSVNVDVSIAQINMLSISMSETSVG
ncbi:hypothetical protein HOG98_09665 [bacterium]|jgi:hypothetical protein|nr:hypothetical protein [bacterium]